MRGWLVLVLLCAGCASSPYSQMTADQINAAVKDRQAGLICAQITGAGGQGALVTVSTDKGALPQASHIQITPGSNCQVTIDTSAPVPVAKP